MEALEGGEIVRLADQGTFQIGLSGRGAETEDAYDVSMIRKARINFRPGIALSGILAALKYTKVDKLPGKQFAMMQTKRHVRDSGTCLWVKSLSF